MQQDIITLSLGFLEGLALILSPCILPILPIILAGSLLGSKKRPIGIIVGFIMIFALVTFFSRLIAQYSGINFDLIRYFAYAILLLLGITMASSYLTERFMLLTHRLANIGSHLSFINNPQGGFISGILFGGLVAVIWTPCAGPILAAVIVQTVIQQTTIMSFLTVLAFGLGAAIPMLAIALFGRRMMARFGSLKKHTNLFRKILGWIIIISVVYIVFFEGGVSIAAPDRMTSTTTTLQNRVTNPYPAPAIAGINDWINSPPLQLSNLKGKVILIDFWTYSCINCLRTLPYLKEWYNKYHDKGLVIIGIHTPEFEFEKNVTNVKNAVNRLGILYPVALDNQFATWRNFNNSYWPAHYLIDDRGYVVYTHFGEGDYDVTENNIRYLLGINESASSKEKDEKFSTLQTPETYFGYLRADRFVNTQLIFKDQKQTYTFPEELAEHAWALQGDWIIKPDRIISAQADAALKIRFHARKVFIVMGSDAQQTISVKLLLNGGPVIGDRGKDVENGSISVNKHMLYEAVVMSHSGEGILQIIPSAPGLEVYTFTFGE